MSETPRQPDDSRFTRTSRGMRWDALAAIVASLVGLLALGVGGYTAYIQREQVRAQVWPYLQMGKSNAGGHFEMVAINRGVGPVLVRSVQVLADGKPVNAWGQLNRLLDSKRGDDAITSTLNQTVLAPGTEVHWIVFKDAAGIDGFIAGWARLHVEARVCYASTLGETWLTVFRPGWPGGYPPRPVSGCPELPDAQQFDG